MPSPLNRLEDRATLLQTFFQELRRQWAHFLPA
jgi:hypothetical protein